jgi:predicted dehydrogenase
VSTNPLSAVLVGCGGMGKNQARILARHPDFRLLAVCDRRRDVVGPLAAELGVEASLDFAEALETHRPDVAAVCTDNASHAPLTILAAERGVRGVYCEKPMATCMRDARAMLEACTSRNIPLVINHQRRIGPDLVEARRLVEAGAIGRLHTICGNCPGDALSDGTHLVDSILHIAGDRAVRWVAGQITREVTDEVRAAAAEKGREPGSRYGHPVETGAFAVFALEPDPDQDPEHVLRVEIACGELRDRFRAYQDYEILGDAGRLWRTGDRVRPNLFIADGKPGTCRAGLDGWTYKPVPADGGGPWRPVEHAEPRSGSAIFDGYTGFARAVRDGEPHPMDGRNAIRGFEVIMALYESARLHRRLTLPLEQGRFPLEIMIEDGDI